MDFSNRGLIEKAYDLRILRQLRENLSYTTDKTERAKIKYDIRILEGETEAQKRAKERKEISQTSKMAGKMPAGKKLPIKGLTYGS